MENETEKELINYTSCLRSEYKDPARLSGCRESLVIYVKSCQDQIDEYDRTHYPSGKAEPVHETWKKDYIDDVRGCLIRAKKYLRQVEAEKNSVPPLPELPPTKPLIKISGIVEELSVKKVIGYFDFSEYSTEKARAEEKIKRDNEGASLLLLLQFFAGDAPHARFNDGKRKESRCIYVEGKVDGKLFSGWLKQTNIQVGDYVEMAVIPQGNEYKTYAITKPQDGIISITPKCQAGSKSVFFKDVLKATAMVLGCMLICIIVIAFFAIRNFEGFLYVILFYCISTLLVSFFVHRELKKENYVTGDLFERICLALNIPNGKKLELDRYSKEKIKIMKEKGEWIANAKNNISYPQISKEGNFEIYYYPLNNKI